MDLMRMVYVIIGITISVIIAANVLLPVITDLTKEGGALADNAMWSTLIILVGTLTIIAVVMMAVRAMSKSGN